MERYKQLIEIATDLFVGRMEETKELITTDDIRSKVYIIRGQQVMLDKDLAEIYGYEVKKLNQQVKRNIERFPEDFMFRLSNSEIDSVRSQFVTSRKKDFFAGQEGGRRYLPYAFTEQGIYMLATVLRGELAVQQSIFIMRTFREMRHYIRQNQQFVTRNEMDLLTAKVGTITERQDRMENKVDSIQKDEKISEENVYQFLLYFDKLYDRFTDLEKKEFLNSFVEQVDIYEQEQPDGRFLKHIKFRFPVYFGDRETQELCRDNESTVETVVLLSQQKQDDYINVTIELDDVDITSEETKSTYDEIKKYVAEHNAGMKVSNLYISQVKKKCGIEVGKNLRVATRRMDCLQGNSTTAATDLELVPSSNLPKNEDSRQPQCSEDKESAIVEALKHFKMNS